jgi:HSP20 family protein
MALIRWSPWQGLFDIHREMDSFLRRTTPLFDNFPTSRLMGGTSSAWVPPVDVFHREKDLVIRAELPGINPEEDVDITVQDNALWIRGERRREERTERDGTYRIESSYGSFERGVPIPDGVRPEDITASYENGILEVVLPGAAELTGGRKIPVQVGSNHKALTVGRRKR